MARVKAFDKTRVLDKALDLFWTRGYNATSMQDLVDHLQLNRSSIYNAFGDKRSLFIECLDRYRRKQVRATLDMVDECDDPVTAVRKIFQLVIEADITAKIPRGCLMVNSTVELGPHDRRIAEILRAHGETVREALFRAVTRGQAHGRISRKHDARALAGFLHNNISAMRLAMQSQREPESLKEITNIIMSVLEC